MITSTDPTPQASASSADSSKQQLPVEWLRVKEAMAYAKVAKATLYDWMNEGLIRSFVNKRRGQIKGTRLISFDSLREFLFSNCTPPKA
jgi:hypothetical protein